MADGRVLVAGGTTSASIEDPTAAAQVYDPETRAWTSAGSMGAARYGATAVLLNDGRVLVIGGETLGTELYDPTAAP